MLVKSVRDYLADGIMAYYEHIDNMLSSGMAIPKNATGSSLHEHIKCLLFRHGAESGYFVLPEYQMRINKTRIDRVDVAFMDDRGVAALLEIDRGISRNSIRKLSSAGGHPVKIIISFGARIKNKAARSECAKNKIYAIDLTQAHLGIRGKYYRKNWGRIKEGVCV